MTFEERKEKIASYGDAPRQLMAALAEMPPEMWQYKPAPDKWSVHEIIIHLADSEAHTYIRFRHLMAEPGSSVSAYDQDLWAEELYYHEQSLDDALELFRLLRKMTHRLLERHPDEAWGKTIIHPVVGVMTFDDLLSRYELHARAHIAQMRRNLVAWQEEVASSR